MVGWLLRKPRKKKVLTTVLLTRSWEFKYLLPGPAASSNSMAKLHPQNATDLHETARNEEYFQWAKPSPVGTDGLQKETLITELQKYCSNRKMRILCLITCLPEGSKNILHTRLTQRHNNSHN